jgi:hypothetical protein
MSETFSESFGGVGSGGGGGSAGGAQVIITDSLAIGQTKVIPLIKLIRNIYLYNIRIEAENASYNSSINAQIKHAYNANSGEVTYDFWRTDDPTQQVYCEIDGASTITSDKLSLQLFNPTANQFNITIYLF